eukprot:3089853-Pleurochrysis_carterae.AAC.1
MRLGRLHATERSSRLGCTVERFGRVLDHCVDTLRRDVIVKCEGETKREDRWDQEMETWGLESLPACGNEAGQKEPCHHQGSRRGSSGEESLISSAFASVREICRNVSDHTQRTDVAAD